MDNLFICKTPYQLIVIIQLVLTKFKHENNTVLISDNIANYEKLYENVKKTNVFSKVIKFSFKKTYSNKSKIFFLGEGIKYKLNIQTNNVWSKLKKQDKLFICNMGKEESIVYHELKKKNPFIKAYMFEDGFASYSLAYATFFNKITNKKGMKEKLLYPYRKLIYDVFFSIEGFYAFSPQLYAWTPPAPILEIEKIDPTDKERINIFNLVFGVKEIEEGYKKNFIFFEESYFADGINVADKECIYRILKDVPKEDIFIKIHPRNPINRFKELGFETNINTEIPWEIIALNINIENKVLITIASGSALTSLINTKTTPKKVIMLMNCDEFSDENLTPTLPTLRMIAEEYPELVRLPKSMEELSDILKD